MLLPVPLPFRQDIQAIHDRMARQYVTKSYDEMVALTTARFAPDFRYRKLVGAPMDLLSFSAMRDDELGRAAVGRGDGPLRWRTRLVGWSLRGGTLTVMAHHDVVGEWLLGDRRHPVRFASAALETWERRDGEWKAARFDEVWVRGTMDGRTFERGKRPAVLGRSG